MKILHLSAKIRMSGFYQSKNVLFCNAWVDFVSKLRGIRVDFVSKIWHIRVDFVSRLFYKNNDTSNMIKKEYKLTQSHRDTKDGKTL